MLHCSSGKKGALTALRLMSMLPNIEWWTWGILHFSYVFVLHEYIYTFLEVWRIVFLSHLKSSPCRCSQSNKWLFCSINITQKSKECTQNISLNKHNLHCLPHKTICLGFWKARDLACKQYDKVLHSLRNCCSSADWFLAHSIWMTELWTFFSAAAFRTVEECCALTIWLGILLSYSGVGRI